MSLKPGYFTPLLFVAAGAASIAVAPVAAADPNPVAYGARSATATIDNLQAKGYDVQINWVTGQPDVPLSECWATAVHNPNPSGAVPGTLTTVYVDVSCPSDNHSGIGFGAGLGGIG